MKKIFILMMGLLFTASAVFASPNAKVEFATMNKADTQMLFGDISDMNMITLGSAEMKATEGEWFSWAVRIAAPFVLRAVFRPRGDQGRYPTYDPGFRYGFVSDYSMFRNSLRGIR